MCFVGDKRYNDNTIIDLKFDWPIIYTDSSKSIHKNHNNVWDNKVHVLIAKMRSPTIFRSDLATFISKQFMVDLKFILPF